MITFDADKQVKLLEAKHGFHEAMFENDFFSRIVRASLEKWQVSEDAGIKITMEPSLTSEKGVAEPHITGGVQFGFERRWPGGSTRKWYFIDLFTYLPGTVGYDPAPIVLECASADQAEVGQLFDHWCGAVRELMAPFMPEDLYLNRPTCEIDLRENIIPEDAVLISLPTTAN